MSVSWIGMLTFASASLLALSLGMLVHDHFIRYRFAVRERLKELYDAGSAEGVSLFKGISDVPAEKRIGQITWKEQFEHLVEQAGLPWTPFEFALRSLCVGTLGAITGSYWNWWLAALSFPLAAGIPLGILYMRRHARQRALSRQLPEAFEMISRAVRAGQTVPAALQIIAQDFDPPICQEFALCYEQQNLGISRESSLRKLAERTGIMELQIFVVALLVQARSGGDLVELLENLSTMVRKRLKLKDRVRALTGEGRMQALVLIVLPIIAFVAVIVLSPDYAQSLLDRPWLLMGTVAAQFVGALWIRQIVNFEF